jgi:integrase
MIEAQLSRGVVNQRIGRIKRMFKWAVAEELVPESVYRALLAVDGLKAGRSAARETEPVLPVSDAHVDAVLPFLSRPLQGLVQVQRMTGMRPGEVMRMRGADLDTSGTVWFFRPIHHKTAWRQKTRTIPIGPRCQQILQSFLKPDPQAFLFSPQDGREDWFAAKRAARKSKVPPSQLCRRKANPRRKPRECYSRHSYAAAIARACVKAGVPRWHPNQLRHTRATEIRRQYGLEAAQVLLGHARANVTEVYAERNFELAERVAAEAG